MQEISVPPVVVIPETTNCTDFVERQAQDPANRALFAVLGDNGQWQDIRATEFRADVIALAKGLIALGVQPGDKVGIMSRTRYEWTLVDFAIWYAGAVSVPVYETSAPSQIAWNLSDSEAIAIFAESEQHVASIRQAIASEGLEAVKHLWQITGNGLDELRNAGQEVNDADVEARRTSAGLRDLATIIYTSGTTGRPKGVELTHGNFVELADNAMGVLGRSVVTDDAQTIMFLPLAHVFGRYISIMNIAGGARVAHTPDIKNLLADFQSFHPTYILAVPRVFEKVYNSAVLKAEPEGKGKIFAQAADVAIAYSRAKQEGKIPFMLNLKHTVFDKLVYNKLRAAMGGQLTYAVSGGGPLGERLGHFFYGVGVMVLEGYGLTETTAPVTVNQPDQIKIGTVGRPLPGNSVKIADDGEVLVKGVCLTRGYHGRDDLTQESFSGEWFRTGDIGALDDEGFLRITGRKKEIIITAGGKNVAPAQLENQIRSDALVSQCVVVGEGKPFIAALVTLDEEALPQWASQHGLSQQITPEQASTDPIVLAAAQKTVDHANESVSHAEAIKAFRIVPTDFSEASGHLTPSLKIKRAQVLKDFSNVVEEIYSAPKPA
ncbi:long-chain-fatty-acid--CoA ligase [Renibacterium salmoninarum ATCC 33209]|uniref:Acyl-CoA synthetase n=1 Tax=Renibacterium salmoninarum (strain ATCC 33209 / DSM 20767 / JCM 11484 / NBRC 15589 / NCIMB 2235) TaxID=288705 RepID=A9WRG3_RENSM|nr:AMP-dependent synthetase/ligase [Renibacterium salmoninarum]ABY24245.1 long-chain-fatty-acid--CoA ligase [Renibacterium salmoninarum ATCC 33209]